MLPEHWYFSGLFFFLLFFLLIQETEEKRQNNFLDDLQRIMMAIQKHRSI